MINWLTATEQEMNEYVDTYLKERRKKKDIPNYKCNICGAFFVSKDGKVETDKYTKDILPSCKSSPSPLVPMTSFDLDYWYYLTKENKMGDVYKEGNYGLPNKESSWKDQTTKTNTNYETYEARAEENKKKAVNIEACYSAKFNTIEYKVTPLPNGGLTLIIYDKLANNTIMGIVQEEEVSSLIQLLKYAESHGKAKETDKVTCG